MVGGTIDVSKNFERQPIKHVVKSRRSRTMYCDKCRYGRRLVWHAEENRILCPECGRTPQVLQDKVKELENMPEEPGSTTQQNTLVTADGFTSSGTPVNLGGMKMRSKFGPRAYSTIQKEEFGPIDSDTQQMLDNNPDYRLVDYKETIPE
jgi:hypothetical protein